MRTSDYAESLWKPGAGTKAVAFIVGAVCALFAILQPNGYGWWGGGLMATVALVVPSLQYRKLWNRRRFWMAVLFLGLIQIPIVISVQPLIEQLRAAFLLAFGIVDGIFTILVISFICSPPKRKDN